MCATENQEIFDDVIAKWMEEAILTAKKHHKSGTDRIYEAYKKLGHLRILIYILNYTR